MTALTTSGALRPLAQPNVVLLRRGADRYLGFLFRCYPDPENWLHIGSQQPGPRVAAILSVVESCRRLKIPVRAYLGDILPGLANTKMQRVADSHTRRMGRQTHSP
jgi:hypothetical protein